MFSDPAFWTAIAFFIFLAAVAKPMWRAAMGGLDKRTAAIKAELDEAQQLREEAQHLLAEFQRKQRDAVKDSAAILEHASEEAKRHGKVAAADLAAALKRRGQQAKDRIAQAEAQAIADVRAAAVDLAVMAAGRVMAEALGAAQSASLIDTAIKDLPEKLH